MHFRNSRRLALFIALIGTERPFSLTKSGRKTTAEESGFLLRRVGKVITPTHCLHRRLFLMALSVLVLIDSSVVSWKSEQDGLDNSGTPEKPAVATKNNNEFSVKKEAPCKY